MGDVDPARRTFLLANLDAEDELARGAHAPSVATRRAMESAAARLVASGLVPAALVPVAAAAPADSLRGARAVAWCPTPGAMARLATLGLVWDGSLEAALGAPSRRSPSEGDAAAPPPLSVLALANDRATFALSSPLPGSAVVRSPDELEERLVAAPRGSRWLLRRAHSAAGRGARRVCGGAALAPGDAVWVRASTRLGAVTLDPFVALTRELALHGWLGPDGRAVFGEACEQSVDAAGTWRATARLTGAERELREALDAAGRGVAERLAALAYHGPFGLDAYTWRDAAGRTHLRAPSEVNARFAMGWWVGLGGAPR